MLTFGKLNPQDEVAKTSRGPTIPDPTVAKLIEQLRPASTAVRGNDTRVAIIGREAAFERPFCEGLSAHPSINATPYLVI
jgi:hypothetical protein